MLPYIEAHLTHGGRLQQITRHMLGLFAGRPGARGWRRVLSEGATQPGAGPDLLVAALAQVTALAPDAKAVEPAPTITKVPACPIPFCCSRCWLFWL